MLDDIKIAYDPTANINALYVDSDTTHTKTAFYLTRGHIPNRLIEIGAQSTNFRDAVLSYMLDNADRNDLELALKAVTTAISCLDDGDVRLLPYSEYAAVLAAVLDEKAIASKVIKRNELSTASSLLKTIAMAISKSMPGNAFNELMKNSTRGAVSTWVDIERPVLYPIG